MGVQIRDETNYSQLVENSQFQTVDLYKEQRDEQAASFANEVSELENSKVHFARNPLVRIAIGGGLLFFMIGFGLVSKLGQQRAQVVTDAESEAIESVELDNTTEEENDRLRSELALLQQQMELADMERDPISSSDTTANTSRPRTSTTTPNQVTNRTPTRATPTSTTASVKTASTRTAVPARPTTVPARSTAVPVRTSPPRTPVRQVPAPVSSSRAATPSVPVPPSSTPSTSYTPPDPQEAWLAASMSGVIGTMPNVEDEVQPVSQNEPVESVEFQPEYYLKSQSVTSPKPFSTSFADYQEVDVEVVAQSIPGLRSNSEPAAIALGTAAKGVVSTPISWLDDGAQYIITLTEDVVDTSGYVAIPSGSLVIVQSMQVDPSTGYAKLAVVGLSMDGEIIPVDFRTMDIYGRNGDPLIAERYGDVGGDIAANDAEMFAIGALGGVGRVLTRPDSQVITTGTFGSTVSTNNGDRNILGAILDGGTQELIGRMGDRNDQRLAEIRSRPDIFYLKEGTEVVFYINEELSLPNG